MRRLLAALILPAVLLPGPSAAIDPGTAKGTLTTARGAVPLTHAYAVEHKNEEGMGDGPELRVLLADREVPQSLLSGPVLGALDSRVREGGLRGVLLRLDPKRLAAGPVRGTLLEAPADPQQSLLFFTLSGDGGLEGLKVDATRVTGRARHAVTDGPTGDFGYDVAFSAPRFTDAVTTRLTGAKAVASEPAKAMLAWERAVRAGDLAAARAYASPAKMAQLEAFVAAVGVAEFRKQVAAGIPDQKTREREIREVILRGDRASVVFQEKGGRGVAVLVREDGAWKAE